ncbi:hypothetical protein DFQ27_008545 [Actinomortierella ambigua]|uniref:J domain-containing protein n=1 Tax=Actinomortierella ambigua TaxID=1343610 RepID=A0A9P6QIX2_9FUNG|nr:hypothetical protein DFQ27_008545 [Actinomortierella ambigua]
MLRPFRTRLRDIQPVAITSSQPWACFSSPPTRRLHATPRIHERKRLTHYEHLELEPSADRKRIKAQFYRLSKLHHPDKTASEESRQKFLKINEAYSVLGNDRSRFEYDLTLRDRSDGLYSSGSSSSHSSSRAAPNRGTLRRTPFRHSPHSAAAAAAAQRAAAQRSAAFRPSFGQEAPSHFDAKAHQEMHYEQELRHQERLKKRVQESEEYQRQQRKESEDSWSGRVLRVSFLFLIVIVVSSLPKVFADEKGKRTSKSDSSDVDADDGSDGDNNDDDEEMSQIKALWECRSTGATPILLEQD